jgi:adenosylcobinamide-GDP ribazoletransferase
MNFSSIYGTIMRIFIQWVKTFLGAITFYTIIPIPTIWQLNFQGIARYAPLVGLLLGLILAGVDFALDFFGLPILTRSGLLVALGIVLTGGLHLDGVMDTADGLGVFNNPQKRLEVMKDSVTGAFGVMAGCVVIVLKIIALSDITSDRTVILMACGGWGRWAQVVAIACYPYLREKGKGSLHKENIQPKLDIFISFLFYVIFSAIVLILSPEKHILLLKMLGLGVSIGIISGYWFYRQLGGHTGDTYGAVVEWTETLFLCLLTGK